MYIDVRLYDNITNHKITASDFEVSCAGHAVVEENSPDNNRTNGLPDYQLLYIENGCGFFKFGEDYEKLPGKTVVLYHPSRKYINTVKKIKPKHTGCTSAGQPLKSCFASLSLTIRK